MKKLITATLVILFSIQVQAGIVEYSVSDAAGNCGDAGTLGSHGLWTNSLYDTDVSCPTSSADPGNYFSMTAGSLFVDTDAGFGFLGMSAVNSIGSVASIAIDLSGLIDPWTGPVKNPFGADVSAWDVFSVIDGLITIVDADSTVTTYAVSGHGAMGFQIGMGANDKNTGFGASTWLDVSGYGPGHWDINLNITPVPAPTSNTF